MVCILMLFMREESGEVRSSLGKDGRWPWFQWQVGSVPRSGFHWDGVTSR